VTQQPQKRQLVRTGPLFAVRIATRRTRSPSLPRMPQEVARFGDNEAADGTTGFDTLPHRHVSVVFMRV